jgi:DNA repair exonuclease SbcCD nuclease subunit
VFDTEGTEGIEVRGTAVAVSGIPCIRRRARSRFPAALERTAWRGANADLRLLIAHQAFEGAVVGPADFTFRTADDVVRLADLPAELTAVLAGHIHRSQVLETDLRGRPCPVPVLYPGSIERTAFAEKDEPKGFLTVDITPDPGGAVLDWTFRNLGARPMIVRPLRVEGLGEAALEAELRRALAAEPADAVLRLEADGPPIEDAAPALRAARLRELAPTTMNVEVRIPGVRPGRRRRAASASPSGEPRGGGDRAEPAQQDLFER